MGVPVVAQGPQAATTGGLVVRGAGQTRLNVRRGTQRGKPQQNLPGEEDTVCMDYKTINAAAEFHNKWTTDHKNEKIIAQREAADYRFLTFSVGTIDLWQSSVACVGFENILQKNIPLKI